MSDREVGKRDGSDDEDDDALLDADDLPLHQHCRTRQTAIGTRAKGKARAEAPSEDSPEDADEPATSSGLLAPCSVGASATARFQYLRHLSDHAAYQKLLEHWRVKVRCGPHCPCHYTSC